MSDDQIIGGLVNRLRGLACPAGEPWTGTTPESDHGHTDCFIIHRAADALEAAEAKFAAIAAVHVPSIGIVPACCFCDELWPCTHHRILHPEEEQ